MPIKTIITKGRVPVKIYTDDIDSGAYDQLTNISQLPIITPHIAAMPDVHQGIGATVGSVIPTKNAIIPAAVGVIMQAVEFLSKHHYLNLAPHPSARLRLERYFEHQSVLLAPQ